MYKFCYQKHSDTIQSIGILGRALDLGVHCSVTPIWWANVYEIQNAHTRFRDKIIYSSECLGHYFKRDEELL